MTENSTLSLKHGSFGRKIKVKQWIWIATCLILILGDCTLQANLVPQGGQKEVKSARLLESGQSLFEKGFVNDPKGKRREDTHKYIKDLGYFRGKMNIYGSGDSRVITEVFGKVSTFYQENTHTTGSSSVYDEVKYKLEFKILSKKSLTTKILYLKTPWLSLKKTESGLEMRKSINFEFFEVFNGEILQKKTSIAASYKTGFIYYNSLHSSKFLVNNLNFKLGKLTDFYFFTDKTQKIPEDHLNQIFSLSKSFEKKYRVIELQEVDKSWDTLVFFLLLVISITCSGFGLFDFYVLSQEKTTELRKQKSIPLIALFSTIWIDIGTLRLLLVIIQNFTFDTENNDEVMAYLSLLKVPPYILVIEIFAKLKICSQFYSSSQLRKMHGDQISMKSFYFGIAAMTLLVFCFISIDPTIVLLIPVLVFSLIGLDNWLFSRKSFRSQGTPVFILSKILLIIYFCGNSNNIGFSPVLSEPVPYAIFFYFLTAALVFIQVVTSTMFEYDSDERRRTRRTRQDVFELPNTDRSLEYVHEAFDEEGFYDFSALEIDNEDGDVDGEEKEEGGELISPDKKKRISRKAKRQMEFDRQVGSECSICFDEMITEGDLVITNDLGELPKKVEKKKRLFITSCNHLYHKECLDPWIYTTGKCPICKKKIDLRHCKKYK